MKSFRTFISEAGAHGGFNGVGGRSYSYGGYGGGYDGGYGQGGVPGFRVPVARLHTKHAPRSLDVGVDPIQHYNAIKQWQQSIFSYIVGRYREDGYVPNWTNSEVFAPVVEFNQWNKEAIKLLEKKGIIGQEKDIVASLAYIVENEFLDEFRNEITYEEYKDRTTHVGTPDPEGHNLIMYFNRNDRKNWKVLWKYWDATGATLPLQQWTKFDMPVTVRGIPIYVQNAQKGIFDFMQGERGKYAAHNTLGRVWNQATQGRLNKFHGTSIFGDD